MMAKVQGKKSVAGKKVAASKPAARAKSAKPAPKRPAKAAKSAAKSKAPVKKAAKKVAKKAAPPKATAKPKVTAKGAAPAKATTPTKLVPKPNRPQAPPPAKAAEGARAPEPVAAPPRAAAEPEKKRRRSRPKVTSGGPATAAWFSKGDNKPRPSSFIPAPPRAEAPSRVAAPPASSDRLVSHAELTAFAVRTAPVRIDVEASGGRIFLHIFPENVELRVGEGIEWDFRYVNGADVTIDELIVEFDKPSPFSTTTFRSKRPGINRPHRQLSGPVLKAAVGKQFRYTVRALNAFRTELATARPAVTVV
jgi:hypothetical protein